MTLAINLLGLLLMAAVAIWFWLWPARSVAASAGQVIDIEVANGVYTPDVIALRRGETATLRFHRRDPSPCAEQVIFHGLGISAELPVGGIRNVDVTPAAAGTFAFTCQMQMYRGELRVSG